MVLHAGITSHFCVVKRACRDAVHIGVYELVLGKHRQMSWQIFKWQKSWLDKDHYASVDLFLTYIFTKIAPALAIATG